MAVCLIIPAYNEGSVIRDVVRGLRRTFEKSGLDFHIVVVNDGSKDNTALEAAAGGAHVVDHILNTGSGGATATGLSYAFQNGYEIAATMDGDGQHAADDVLAGIKLMQKGEHD